MTKDRIFTAMYRMFLAEKDEDEREIISKASESWADSIVVVERGYLAVWPEDL